MHPSLPSLWKYVLNIDINNRPFDLCNPTRHVIFIFLHNSWFFFARFLENSDWSFHLRLRSQYLVWSCPAASSLVFFPGFPSPVPVHTRRRERFTNMSGPMSRRLARTVVSFRERPVLSGQKTSVCNLDVNVCLSLRSFVVSPTQPVDRMEWVVTAVISLTDRLCQPISSIRFYLCCAACLSHHYLWITLFIVFPSTGFYFRYLYSENRTSTIINIFQRCFCILHKVKYKVGFF